MKKNATFVEIVTDFKKNMPDHMKEIFSEKFPDTNFEKSWRMHLPKEVEESLNPDVVKVLRGCCTAFFYAGAMSHLIALAEMQKAITESGNEFGLPEATYTTIRYMEVLTLFQLDQIQKNKVYEEDEFPFLQMLKLMLDLRTDEKTLSKGDPNCNCPGCQNRREREQEEKKNGGKLTEEQKQKMEDKFLDHLADKIKNSKISKEDQEELTDIFKKATSNKEMQEDERPVHFLDVSRLPRETIKKMIKEAKLLKVISPDKKDCDNFIDMKSISPELQAEIRGHYENIMKMEELKEKSGLN